MEEEEEEEEEEESMQGDQPLEEAEGMEEDRKSTRLNSSH